MFHIITKTQPSLTAQSSEHSKQTKTANCPHPRFDAASSTTTTTPDPQHEAATKRNTKRTKFPHNRRQY